MAARSSKPKGANADRGGFRGAKHQGPGHRGPKKAGAKQGGPKQGGGKPGDASFKGRKGGDQDQAKRQGQRGQQQRGQQGQQKAQAQLRSSSPLLSLPEGTHVIPGRQPVTEALKAKRPLSAIFIERNLNLSPIPELAQEQGITVAYAGRDEMETATGGVMHQGVVAVAKPTPEPNLNDHLNHDLVVVADGITDARNLGAIARSAVQAGAGCLIVRARRAASTSPAAEKASAGAFAWLPVITVSNITNAVNTLKENGMWAVALDSGDDAQNLHQLNLMDERVALIVGEEGAGISRVVRQNADAITKIPMTGQLESLNASVATGIALFEWVRRHTNA